MPLRALAPAWLLPPALLLACGGPSKPVSAPSAPPPTAGAPAPSASEAGPSAPALAHVETAGGVNLDPILAEVGPRRDELIEIATLFASDRPAAVRRTTALGATAHALVAALLGSRNLDELIGALEVARHPGDPAGVHADVLRLAPPLLGHSVGAVRDAAWATLSQVATADELVTLLPAVDRDRKIALIRLLAAWDGSSVHTALGALIDGDDASLADEATLALSAPGKTYDDAVASTISALVGKGMSGDGPALARSLTIYRRLPNSPLLATDYVQRAVASTHLRAAVEGARATTRIAPADGQALRARLVTDARPEVRAALCDALATGAPDAEALITKLLADDDANVRVAALRARAAFGTPAAQEEALKTALLNPNRGVRLAAVALLATPERIEANAARLADLLPRENKAFQEFLMQAVVSTKTRAGVKIAVDALKLEAPLKLLAAIELANISGKNFPAERAPWLDWLDATYPVRSPSPN